MTLVSSEVTLNTTPNMKKTITQIIKLLAIMSIINIVVCTNMAAAATVKKEDSRKSNLDKIDDKTAQASEEVPQHVYGSSYENILNKPGLDDYQITDPMAAAASHYYSGGSKGWLDMGAWTKKKGAFGWYADFPVGKGR